MAEYERGEDVCADGEAGVPRGGRVDDVVPLAGHDGGVTDAAALARAAQGQAAQQQRDNDRRMGHGAVTEIM